MISVIKSKHQTPTLHAVPNVTGTDSARRKQEQDYDRREIKGGLRFGIFHPPNV
jgi:hypothetical protein